MGGDPVQAEWYYVGHYGQLGPLTFEQIQELARDGVIGPDTFVWKPGLGDWRPAQQVPELRSAVVPITTEFSPPPPPGTFAQAPAMPPASPSYAPQYPSVSASQWSYLEASVPKSEKSRVASGLLNLLPGFGRFYLGYSAHGALQLLTTLFCGIGYLWSVIDGIYILMGGVKYDGYGRRLQD